MFMLGARRLVDSHDIRRGLSVVGLVLAAGRAAPGMAGRRADHPGGLVCANSVLLITSSPSSLYETVFQSRSLLPPIALILAAALLFCFPLADS
jgi:hypothetical protein